MSIFWLKIIVRLAGVLGSLLVEGAISFAAKFNDKIQSLDAFFVL
jgi:hypothetical protein